MPLLSDTLQNGDNQYLVEWYSVRNMVKTQFGKKPDLQTILFLIGVNELGAGHLDFTKEQKQDLIHIGVCSLLSKVGYYEFEGDDVDGWPHYAPTTDLPPLKLAEQERILKQQVILYFKERGDL